MLKFVCQLEDSHSHLVLNSAVHKALWRLRDAARHQRVSLLEMMAVMDGNKNGSIRYGNLDKV